MSESSLEGHLHRRCGGRYVLGSEEVTIRLSGMSATVERGVFRCSSCGDLQRTVEQREAAEQAAIADLRECHGLYTPKEIRRLRESWGLTAEQLGDLLYGTPRGVVEGWEKGRYLQNPSVDAMLKSFTDRPTLEERAARAGVPLPTPEEVAAQHAARYHRGPADGGRRTANEEAGVAADVVAIGEGEEGAGAAEADDPSAVRRSPSADEVTGAPPAPDRAG